MRTVRGIVALAGLAIGSRFRLRGRYWTWRWETAAGNERIPAGERRRAMLEYGRWVADMRRLGR